MTRPAVTFPDAMLSTVNALRTALAARSEPVAVGVKVGTVFPNDGETPFVMVRTDGVTVEQRYAATALVRLAVWHTTEAKALALAGICAGLLCATSADGVRSYVIDSGPYPAADPDSGNAVAALTLSARLRPTTL